jgi:hypothetical protein
VFGLTSRDPILSVELSADGTQLKLNWLDGSVLQSADSLSTPIAWTTLKLGNNGARNYWIEQLLKAHRFYRLIPQLQTSDHGKVSQDPTAPVTR